MNCSHLFSDLKITDIATALFTIVLALATVQLARSTNVLAEDTRQNSRERRTANLIEACQNALDKVRALGLRRPPENEDQYDRARAIDALYALELLASLVNTAAIDREIVRDSAEPALIDAYYLLHPIIRRFRHELNNPCLYEEFERLVESFKNSK
jgi:Domain of unknown function (DUF4760)